MKFRVHVNVVTAPSPDEQPVVHLSEWRVIHAADGHLYLFGLREGHDLVRMTTAIQSVDVQLRRWQTASGRHYFTYSSPGESLTPAVIGMFMLAHGLPGQFEDLTVCFWADKRRAEQ